MVCSSPLFFFAGSEESLGDDPPDARQIDLAKQLIQQCQNHSIFSFLLCKDPFQQNEKHLCKVSCAEKLVQCKQCRQHECFCSFVYFRALFARSVMDTFQRCGELQGISSICQQPRPLRHCSRNATSPKVRGFGSAAEFSGMTIGSG